MRIGPCQLGNNLILAPMAGVTDRPFRKLCRRLGAGMAVTEMVTSQGHLRHTQKTRCRLDHSGEPLPRSVQIAGTDPAQMAAAARFCIANGAQIIDINMGCPAKKVCNVAAGSALMRDERRVAAILTAVVAAVAAPVTLKIRTGWDRDCRNAPVIARIAEDCGIQALTVHGRTRADMYRGSAEYDTIAGICAAASIPVIANGDIDSPQKARRVLEHTGADGLMIGRAAQGRPWIFREVQHYLATGNLLAEPQATEVCSYLVEHLRELHAFYGEYNGVRIARKHIAWYCNRHAGARIFIRGMNRVTESEKQLDLVQDYFAGLEHAGHDSLGSKVA